MARLSICFNKLFHPESEPVARYYYKLIPSVSVNVWKQLSVCCKPELLLLLDYFRNVCYDLTL